MRAVPGSPGAALLVRRAGLRRVICTCIRIHPFSDSACRISHVRWIPADDVTIVVTTGFTVCDTTGGMESTRRTSEPSRIGGPIVTVTAEPSTPTAPAVVDFPAVLHLTVTRVGAGRHHLTIGVPDGAGTLAVLTSEGTATVLAQQAGATVLAHLDGWVADGADAVL